jgi:flagellar hook-length control protein FliK
LVESVTAVATAVIGATLVAAPSERPAPPPADHTPLAAASTAPPALPVDATLATLALADRIQSQVQTASTTVAAANLAPPAASPLSLGAAQLSLALQPAAKPAQAPTQARMPTKTDAAATSNPTSAGLAESTTTTDAVGAAPAPPDGAQNQSGDHSGGQAGGGSSGNAPAQAANAADPRLATTAVIPLDAPAAPVTASLPAGASPIASQIATQVVKAIEGKTTRFDIALEPAGMGRVDVSVRIDAQGQVSAQFSFDNPSAAAEARAQSTQLQQALEQAGFSIGQGGLSFDVGGQGAGLGRQDTAPAPQTAATSQSFGLAESTVITAQAVTRSPSSGLDITI